MSANSFGQLFRITSFGESHGEALGVVIDGCPAGVTFDVELLKSILHRRRPGSALHVSSRVEEDQPEVVSGVLHGKTLGTPIAILVRNTDARSTDYDNIEKSLAEDVNLRTGHADDVWRSKFGHSDVRGGGRASGRETWSRVAAAAVAQMFLRHECPSVQIMGFAETIGEHTGLKPGVLPASVEKMLVEAKEKGESYGGIAQVDIRGLVAGLGQPVFHKLKADLAAAMLSIGATSGIEFGAGFSAATAKGTEFHKIQSVYGGMRGGISTGEDIVLRVAFKPTSSILDVAKRGRHDPCIVPRAAVVCEAMAWLVLADHFLWRRLDQ